MQDYYKNLAIHLPGDLRIGIDTCDIETRGYALWMPASYIVKEYEYEEITSIFPTDDYGYFRLKAPTWETFKNWLKAEYNHNLDGLTRREQLTVSSLCSAISVPNISAPTLISAIRMIEQHYNYDSPMYAVLVKKITDWFTQEGK